MLVFFLSIAFAQDTSPPNEYFTPPFRQHLSGHGPDKPPPSDGYEFKGKGGGSAKAKIGFLMLLSSSIPALSSRKLDTGSPEHVQKKNRALYMAGIGVGLIVWERLQG